MVRKVKVIRPYQGESHCLALLPNEIIFVLVEPSQHNSSDFDKVFAKGRKEATAEEGWFPLNHCVNLDGSPAIDDNKNDDNENNENNENNDNKNENNENNDNKNENNDNKNENNADFNDDFFNLEPEAKSTPPPPPPPLPFQNKNTESASPPPPPSQNNIEPPPSSLLLQNNIEGGEQQQPPPPPPESINNPFESEIALPPPDEIDNPFDSEIPPPPPPPPDGIDQIQSKETQMSDNPFDIQRISISEHNLSVNNNNNNNSNGIDLVTAPVRAKTESLLFNHIETNVATDGPVTSSINNNNNNNNYAYNYDYNNYNNNNNSIITSMVYQGELTPPPPDYIAPDFTTEGESSTVLNIFTIPPQGEVAQLGVPLYVSAYNKKKEKKEAKRQKRKKRKEKYYGYNYIYDNDDSHVNYIRDLMTYNIKHGKTCQDCCCGNCLRRITIGRPLCVSNIYWGSLIILWIFTVIGLSVNSLSDGVSPHGDVIECRALYADALGNRIDYDTECDNKSLCYINDNNLSPGKGFLAFALLGFISLCISCCSFNISHKPCRYWMGLLTIFFMWIFHYVAVFWWTDNNTCGSDLRVYNSFYRDYITIYYAEWNNWSSSTGILLFVGCLGLLLSLFVICLSLSICGMEEEFPFDYCWYYNCEEYDGGDLYVGPCYCDCRVGDPARANPQDPSRFNNVNDNSYASGNHGANDGCCCNCCDCCHTCNCDCESCCCCQGCEALDTNCQNCFSGWCKDSNTCTSGDCSSNGAGNHHHDSCFNCNDCGCNCNGDCGGDCSGDCGDCGGGC